LKLPVDGCVLQVSVSAGGVPKRAVERAWVGRLGLEGDAHREDTVHGGPLRAVCLFSVEVIERLQAEGHPVEPGSVGENLTTIGVEWSTLPTGTRARVGDELLIELLAPALPCDTQRPNFLRREINRISSVLHPSDSRMYARVLREGEVRPGDSIEVLPPDPESDIEAQLLLFRVDAVERKSDLRMWRAAKAGGVDLEIVEDGELAMAARPGVSDDFYSHADGMRTLPNLLPRVLDHYRANRAVGWVGSAAPPWQGAVPDFSLAIFVAEPPDVPDAAPPSGISLRVLREDEGETWLDVVRPIADEISFSMNTWGAAAPRLLAERDVHVLVAEESGRPVGCGALYINKKVGLLRTGVVQPAVRGRGLQRALIAARARLAAELGCDLLTSQAPPDSTSERNLVRMGFRRIGGRSVYRFDPGDDPAPEITERNA
jgi:MOSC domain-containing protein YiiM/GNAT superfamily N-acetyltransferase